MSSTVRSVLCNDVWNWRERGGCQLRFNPDGTGIILCQLQLVVFISAQFDWKPSTRHELLDLELDTTKDFKVVLDLELTLTKRAPSTSTTPEPEGMRDFLNNRVLTDDAYHPKHFTVQLEQGSFWTGGPNSPPGQEIFEYARRLTFDKSPYPPQNQWINGCPAASSRFWERNDFYQELRTTREEFLRPQPLPGKPSAPVN